MSEVEGSLLCVPQRAETAIESNVNINLDSASVLDAETVKNTNTNSSQVEAESDSSGLLKGLLTDDFCHVCDAVLLFESQRISHYEGKKHAQRVRLYLQTKKAERLGGDQDGVQYSADPEKFCELCNMVFSSAVVAKSHYDGKVHAKNMRKCGLPPSTQQTADLASSAPPTGVPAGKAAEEETGQGPKDVAVPTTQEVDLSDPNKYCRLCTASFNNPLMAQQHYSGRKHQRNHSRQALLKELGEESELANSFTCPVCCVSLTSVETYQAHMQGNKHQTKEKKVVELCRSQKKVYDSFQDELADYIQVQKARGVEAKPGQGPEGVGGQRGGDEVLCQSESTGAEETPPPPPPAAVPPPPPLWCPLPFQPPANPFGFGVRPPEPQLWGHGYPLHPPALIGRPYPRGRSPQSSSSSYSDSSSSYSSSSSSSSDYSRERKRRRRKRRERGKRTREQEQDDAERRRSKRRRAREEEEEEEEEEEGDVKKQRREKGRRGRLEGEEAAEEERERRRRERRQKEGDSVEEEDRRRQERKRSRRRGEGHHAKRRRVEEEEGAATEGGMERRDEEEEERERAQGKTNEEREEVKEGRPKHRKEKKRAKERLDRGDARTEEEKLWDESILGLF